MNTAQPIRSRSALEDIKNYYWRKEPNPRNYLLIIIGLNTALRISDILKLRWRDVYDHTKRRIRDHLTLHEQKTGKLSRIFLNETLRDALDNYYRISLEQSAASPDTYIFTGRKHTNEPISRIQAYRIIRHAASACGIDDTISCHSLRKTFGYYAWQQGTSPALLMNIFNHSSYQITKRYLGIEQDDRDSVFANIDI